MLLAGMLAAAGAVTAMAEERIRIEAVHLNIDSSIESGSSSGNVSIMPAGDSHYRVGNVEILNDSDDWIGGMTPRVSFDLYAESGYYFSGSGRSMFTFYGNDASYVTARREDQNAALAVTIKLDKLENGDLTVTGAAWDGTDGVASWEANSSAKYYHVRLFRDDKSVTGTRTTYENYYEFAGDITRSGDYYFEVRAVGGGSEKGDWDSSDTWYVSSREADEISGGYHSSPGGGSYRPGGPGDPYGTPPGNSFGGSYGPGGGTPNDSGSGGPGVSGGNYGSGGPGAAGGNYSSGGPGAVGGNGGAGGSRPGSGKVGWQFSGNSWYYCYPDGSCARNGWLKVSERWDLFRGDGRMMTGWQQYNNQTYFLNDDGSMATGWVKWNSRWYYLNPTQDEFLGCMLRDRWAELDGKSYYLGRDGAMAEGWYQVNGNWYYFYPGSGHKAVNTWIDTLYVNEQGIWAS